MLYFRNLRNRLRWREAVSLLTGLTSMVPSGAVLAETQPHNSDDALATYTFWLVVFTAIFSISTIGLWITARTLKRETGFDFVSDGLHPV